MCACLSMSEMASLTGCEIFAMLLRAYVDDSTDETKERAVVAGAYVGFYRQWNKLQKQWRKRLKQDNVPYFHAASFRRLREPFSVFANPITYPKPHGREAAQTLVGDLEKIIQASGVMGLAVCIDMAVYNEIRATEPDAAEIFPEDAFAAALQGLVRVCAEIVRDEWQEPPNRKIAFVCDDSSSSSRIVQAYSDFERDNPDIEEYMGGLVHQDDKLLPGLQTADMMAHLAKGRFHCCPGKLLG
jgi:hypothetical protein